MCSPSKISRLETGARKASQRDVRDLCELYKVGKKARQELMDLARPDRGQPYWKGVQARANFATFMELETAATLVQTWETTRIPALLQTPRYSRDTISAIEPRHSKKTVDRLVETRQHRQRLLDTQSLQLRCVIDEAALHREIGGSEEMATQILHILEMSRRPNVAVQVIPFGNGAHAGSDGAFTILDFPKDSVGPVVYIEDRSGGRIINERPKITKYQETFDWVRADAASKGETQNRLEEIARTMRTAARSTVVA